MITLTVADVARQLRVNEQVVRRWLRSGRMLGQKLPGGGGWRISAEEIRAFKRGERTHEATPATTHSK